jgi:branched-chain amino acid transport system substrate-binding protein
MKRILWILVAAIVITSMALAGAGCGGGEEGGAKVPGVTDETIKIGYHSGMTGPAAFMGYDALKGLQTAAWAVNDAGGINGRRIEIVWQDDQYNPEVATGVAKRMADVENVFAVVGNVGTTNGVASSKAYEELGIPFIAPAGYSKLVHVPVKQYTFMLSPYWAVAHAVAVDWLLENKGLRNVGYIYQDDEAGRESSEAVDETLKEHGQPGLVATGPFERGATDFSSQVLAMEKAGAEFIFMAAPQPSVAQILKEAQKLDYHPQFVGTTATGDPVVIELAGAEAAEGVMAFVFNPSPDETTPGMLALKEDTERYHPGHVPGFAFFNAYGGMRVLIEGLERAGRDLTVEGFVDALNSIQDLETDGLFGPINFSPTNHSGHDYIKFIVAHDGKWEVLTDWIGVN